MQEGESRDSVVSEKASVSIKKPSRKASQWSCGVKIKRLTVFYTLHQFLHLRLVGFACKIHLKGVA